MKRTVLLIILLFWFGTGVAGAWWLDDHRWKTIAGGPITLVHALNEHPVTVQTG